jgi:hypothetical protein
MPLANIFIWMALLYKGYLIIMHIRNHEWKDIGINVLDN